MLISLTSAMLLLSAVDQEGVISTAPRGRVDLPVAASGPIEVASPSTTVGSAATPHGLSTSEQISNWIGQGRSERSGSDRPWEGPIEDAGPRKPHGEVSVGFGTGGYRDYGAAVQLPIGESGTLSLAVRQSKNDPYAYYPYDYPYDLGGGYGGYRGYGSPFSGWREPGLGLSQSGWMRERIWSQDPVRSTGGTSSSISAVISTGRDGQP